MTDVVARFRHGCLRVTPLHTTSELSKLKIFHTLSSLLYRVLGVGCGVPYVSNLPNACRGIRRIPAFPARMQMGVGPQQLKTKVFQMICGLVLSPLRCLQCILHRGVLQHDIHLRGLSDIIAALYFVLATTWCWEGLAKGFQLRI